MVKMDETAVSCRGLRLSYGPFDVLRGVDLEVGRGELFALLGANGAGKTTTMELLLGQHRPDAGTLRVLGREPYRDRRRLAAEVGVVLQDGGCVPDLTVVETVRLWLRLRRRRDAVRAAQALLDELRLDHRRAVRVRHLSGGERRRLDLVVALSGEPDLLLLDEPTSGVDPASKAHIRAVLRERLRRGVTVLLTTHDLDEAQTLADRVAIMDAGRVAVTGTIGEVRASGSLSDAFDRVAGRVAAPGALG